MDRNSCFAILRCVLAIAALAGATPTYSASVAEIIDNPRAYVDHTVTIEGRVVGMFSLLVVKYFTVNDGTGSINVITDRPLPKKGEKISVTGKVVELISLGTDTLLAIEEEDEDQGDCEAEVVRHLEERKPQPAGWF